MKELAHRRKRAPAIARLLLVVALAPLALAGCARENQEVVVYSSIDEVFAEPILRAFEQRSKLKIRAVFDTEETKSTGLTNRLIAEAQHPRADVFWSGDPMRALLLVRRGMALHYRSPAAAGLPAPFRASSGLWTGFAARARVLLVNKNRVRPGELPQSIRDLAAPRWKAQTAIANPLYGTTTMHIAALFVAWGETEGRRFMDALESNQVRVASSNGEVRRLVASGEIAFGLLDTDDAEQAVRSGSSVTVVYPDQAGMGTLLVPSTLILIRGRPHPERGRQLIDFLLSPEVEQKMAVSGYMPLHPGVPAPPSVKRATDLRVMHVDYDRIAGELERIQSWLRKWVGL